MILIIMAICILSSVALLVFSVKHFYRYVVKIPKQQRTLTVTTFYVTAFVTLLAIMAYSAFSFRSQSTTLLLTFVFAMQAVSELGIQVIAVSQASSALELCLYL